MSLYAAILYFFIYAFLGWCIEVVYAYFKRGEWINRGFLNGPLCPVYGVGVVLIVSLVDSILHGLGFQALPVISVSGGFGNLGSSGYAGALSVTFFAVTILTTGVELLTGAVLESLFMTKWWDYSSNKLNYKGYVCLRFSLAWGLAGTGVMVFVHPFVEHLVASMKVLYIQVIVAALLSIFIIDMIMTVRALIDFRKLLLELERITDEYKSAKDKLLDELEGIIDELEEPAEKIKEELGKLNQGVHASTGKLKMEIGKLGSDLNGLTGRLKNQLTALKKSSLMPNGAMGDFLSKRIDLENKLRHPFKTNIHDIYDRFYKLSGKLSTNRLFRSFPDMQSDKFKAQLKAIRERYNEARVKMKKDKEK